MAKRPDSNASTPFMLDVAKPQELQTPGKVDMSMLDIAVDDGDDTIDLDDSLDHFDNLAMGMNESVLDGIGLETVELVQSDIESRADWDSILEQAMSELGFDRKADRRADPFPGASAVRHPLLAQACIEFQSRIMREIMPPGGPVKCEPLGDMTDDKILKADRAQRYMNWLLTEGMQDYREDADRMFSLLALYGNAIKKVYWNSVLDQPSTEFLGIDDFAVPYNARSIQTTPRATHILRLYEHEVQSNMASGLWREVDLSEPEMESPSRAQEKANKIVGLKRPSDTEDDRYVIYECHRLLDLDEGEGELPYIVTVDSVTNTTLSIRRNWEQDDDRKARRNCFVHYKFCPWTGFWAIGLYHIIGGLVKGSTGSLRALMDTAQLTNMPGGFKLAGTRSNGNELQIGPMMFSDLEPPNAAMGAKIGDLVMPLPINPPSPVLFQLLQFLVDAGQKFGSVCVQGLADANEQAPVGTTMALVEQQSIVFSAIHARQHASVAKELQIFRRLLFAHLPEQVEVSDATHGDIMCLRTDFDGSVTIGPVADPAVFSDVQRKMMAQYLMTQLMPQAMQAGVQIDKRSICVTAAKSMGLTNADKMFPQPPSPPQPVPLDPAQEFRAVLTGQPVKAFPGQAHDAHTQFLLAITQDPAYVPILGSNPTFLPGLMALAADHASLGVVEKIAQSIGGPLPQPGQPMAPGSEFQLASAAAQVATQMAQQHQAAAQPPQQQADPAAMAEVQRKTAADQAKHQIEMAKLQTQMSNAEAERQSREKIASAGLQVKAHDVSVTADVKSSDAQMRAETQVHLGHLKAATHLAATGMTHHHQALSQVSDHEHQTGLKALDLLGQASDADAAADQQAAQHGHETRQAMLQSAFSMADGQMQRAHDADMEAGRQAAHLAAAKHAAKAKPAAKMAGEE
jgi:hypothetical protein